MSDKNEEQPEAPVEAKLDDEKPAEEDQKKQNEDEPKP